MRRGGASGGRGRLSAPALASLLLHAGAVLVFAALHGAAPLEAPPPERGVEVVWQDSPEDSAAGQEATAPPASAEATAPEPPAEAEQEAAGTSPPPEPTPPEAPALEAEAPMPPPPEAPPPERALAEAPPPAEEPPAPVEPLPTQALEPPPPPERVEARAAPVPDEPPTPDLPLPPPTPPPPPAPAQARPAAQRQQATQLAAAAAPPRPAPPGPAAPLDAAAGASRAVGAVTPPGLLDGVRNPEPEYPFASRQRGDQGVVTVRLGVSAAGEVTDVQVVATSGYPELDESARRTVQRWRFRPAMRDGVPVAGSIRTAIHFRLR